MEDDEYDEYEEYDDDEEQEEQDLPLQGPFGTPCKFPYVPGDPAW